METKMHQRLYLQQTILDIKMAELCVCYRKHEIFMKHLDSQTYSFQD